MRPVRTILTAAGINVALHLYIGLRLLPDLPVPLAVKVLGVAWLALSAVMMPASLLARRAGEPWADAISWIGLLAMGFFSTLLWLTVARDLFLLVAWAIHWQPAGLAATSAAVATGLALLVTLAGFVNARRTAKVVDVDVPFPGLPDALHGFTIVQLSDVHVGPTIKRRYIERIVERVNALEADVVAITGDLVDGSVPELAAHTAPLAELASRHGTYFVTGNHEYYAGVEPWVEELRRIGLRVLMNEHALIEHEGAALVLGGVTDYSGGRFDERHRSDPHAALANAPGHASARVLLAHQPRTAAAAAAAGFDLQLSGHTHGGQFWPWNLFVPMQQPYTAGLHRHESMLLYVSRGTGYWGPPKRFGAPSEITRIRLVRG